MDFWIGLVLGFTSGSLLYALFMHRVVPDPTAPKSTPFIRPLKPFTVSEKRKPKVNNDESAYLREIGRD